MQRRCALWAACSAGAVPTGLQRGLVCPLRLQLAARKQRRPQMGRSSRAGAGWDRPWLPSRRRAGCCNCPPAPARLPLHWLGWPLRVFSAYAAPLPRLRGNLKQKVGRRGWSTTGGGGMGPRMQGTAEIHGAGGMQIDRLNGGFRRRAFVAMGNVWLAQQQKWQPDGHSRWVGRRRCVPGRRKRPPTSRNQRTCCWVLNALQVS